MMVVKEFRYGALERYRMKCKGTVPIDGNEYIWERPGVGRGSIASCHRACVYIQHSRVVKTISQDQEKWQD